MLQLSIVAALAKNCVIGRNSALPWHLPDDLKRFKALTLGHPVIMGRRTFDSIVARLGKPLPGRMNIVISRAAGKALRSPRWPDMRIEPSLEGAVAAAGPASEAFVIGGAEIYALALPHARRLYLTEILCDIDGDAFFPPLDAKDWREISREPGTDASVPHDFVVYERR